MADVGGQRLYALRAGLAEARNLAYLQHTDPEFVRSLRLADESDGRVLSDNDVEAIGASTARLHQWPPARSLPLVRLTRQAYAERLSAANTTSTLQRSDAGALEVLLGLLQPGANPTQLEHNLKATAVSGFYDHDIRVLAIVGENSGTWHDRLTIAHEYAHALQDQQFATGYLADSAASEDTYMALEALLEGDAILSEAAYLEAQIPLPLGDDLFMLGPRGKPRRQNPLPHQPSCASGSPSRMMQGLTLYGLPTIAGGGRP